MAAAGGIPGAGQAAPARGSNGRHAAACGPSAPALPPPGKDGRTGEGATSLQDWRAGGFGVYVHWPFCAAKCPYCDFNSHVAKSAPDQQTWAQALVRELTAQAAITEPRAVDTVFFGGGTPSLMAPDTVGAVLEAIDRLWGLRDGAEVTLEANPTSVEATRFRGYAAAGVNRISMGVQALNDADLKALGRMHSAAEARAAFAVARAVFDRVSFDLIYARMGQTPEAWAAELRQALDMAVDHLSLYQLTIEDGTRFGELYKLGRLRTPDDDAAAEMYLATQEVCAAAGMPAYEVSNHARPGAESRHNLIYWRYGDYAAAGPGAHGRLTRADGARLATVALSDPAGWIAAVVADGAGFEVEALSSEDQATEYLLMAMRLREGADPGRYARLSGRTLDAERMQALASEGLLCQTAARIAATDRGRPVLNAILRELLA
jgi:putative oxygen-independent coproporphyrinogen III oxidase